MLTTTSAFAQRHEIGILVGATLPSAQVSIPPVVSASGGASFAGQVDYAYFLQETSHGNLYFELPAARVFKAAVNINLNYGGVAASASQAFFTPGLRFRFHPDARWSPYLNGGFGFGWFDAASVQVSGPAFVSATNGIKPAFDFGGGLMLRLNRMWALRGEVRDFVACGSNLPSHNHLVMSLGASIRF